MNKVFRFSALLIFLSTLPIAVVIVYAVLCWHTAGSLLDVIGQAAREASL